MKTCSKCGEFKLFTEFNKRKASKDGHNYICRKCGIKAATKHNRANGHFPMVENKECAQYLGIAVAERLVNHLFNDIIKMPNGNPEFDFICNHDKKIEVKSACITLNLGIYPYWQFHINKNKIADYFLILAFNNREDLEPMYQWLIPGDVLNCLTGTTISSSTINKWKAYRKDIDEARECCNDIKEESR